MKFNSKNISINAVLNQNSLFRFVFHSILSVLFYSVRMIVKLIPYKSQNILIISLHRLGDTIFTIPAINEVYKKFGDRVIIICYPESVPIYKMIFTDLKMVEVKYDDFYFGKRIAKSRVRKKIKSIKPSIVLDITGSMISASLIFNIRADKIVGTNGDQFKTIYDHFVKFRYSPQLKDIYLDAITPLIENVERNSLTKNNISINMEGKILINPFAGWKEKEWNKKKFIELARLLNKDFNVGIIVQKGQIDTDLIYEIDHQNIDLIQTKSVDELIESIKNASLFIGNDSGPVNIACFFGKPSLTLFGATNPDYVKTNFEYNVFLQKELGCSARNNEKFCLIGGMIYQCSGIQCMNLLSVEDVYNALLPLLNLYCKKKI
ncbi:MAG: hypothetical protein DAHOPDDO_00700 [Ignavibacteriaceae bacterium]|nr:hypothetical protein [Ignavibacteriaceae bacterium]